MMDRLRLLHSALLLLALAACAACAVTFTEPQLTDLTQASSAAPGSVAQIVAGPYVQNITPGGVTLMWQTDCPASGEVTVSGGGSSATYSTSGQRVLSEVKAVGLLPDTAYEYAVKVGTVERKGQFRTFPVASRPLKFVVYGDTRSNPERHREVIRAMRSEQDTMFVLHTGDVVSDGRQLDQWIPTYFGPAGEMIRDIPVFAVLGNHERNADYYFQYFSLPGNERWYSFDVGSIHVIGLDSGSDFDIGSAQYKWLIADLAYYKNRRWKFVFMHHPTYTSGEHGSVDERGVPREKPIRVAQQLLPDLAARFGITAVFAGHDHAYERSTRDGVSYVISGGGGAPNYGDPNAKSNPYRQKFYSGLHYCLVSVDGDHANVVVKTPAGRVLDAFELK